MNKPGFELHISLLLEVAMKFDREILFIMVINERF